MLKMNLSLILLSFLFSISLRTYAQSTGHPGGGGPDGATQEQILICKGVLGDIKDLEERFCYSWRKNYKSENDFFRLMEEIMLLNTLHSINFFKADLVEFDYICKKTKQLNLDDKLRKRSPEELKILRDIQTKWQHAFDLNSKCGGIFNQRMNHKDELEMIIKIYDKKHLK